MRSERHGGISVPVWASTANHAARTSPGRMEDVSVDASARRLARSGKTDMLRREIRKRAQRRDENGFGSVYCTRPTVHDVSDTRPRRSAAKKASGASLLTQTVRRESRRSLVARRKAPVFSSASPRTVAQTRDRRGDRHVQERTFAKNSPKTSAFSVIVLKSFGSAIARRSCAE